MEQAKFNDDAGAEQSFRKAIALNPRNAAAHAGLGILFSQQGRESEAIAQLTATLALDPRHSAAHYDLGIWCVSRGKTDSAIDHDSNCIYGAMEPLGNVYRYDIAARKTVDLGRWPTINQPSVYDNRVMWIDSRHQVWTSGGTAAPGN